MGKSSLPPVSPAIKARHRRQNRVIVALAILVAIPIIAISGANRLVTAEASAWVRQPSFPINAPAQVDIAKAGIYVVWTYQASAQCDISFYDQPVATDIPAAGNVMETSGFYPSTRFTAPAGGTYDITCRSSSAQYAMVSTPSPLARLSLILVSGYLIASVGGVTGLVLLILAVTTNAKEKQAQRFSPA